MSDAEYEILDELYFIKTFGELQGLFMSGEFHLEEELWKLIQKEWVKILGDQDEEIVLEKDEFMEQKTKFRFNATKKGLMAHNQV